MWNPICTAPQAHNVAVKSHESSSFRSIGGRLLDWTISSLIGGSEETPPPTADATASTHLAPHLLTPAATSGMNSTYASSNNLLPHGSLHTPPAVQRLPFSSAMRSTGGGSSVGGYAVQSTAVAGGGDGHHYNGGAVAHSFHAPAQVHVPASQSGSSTRTHSRCMMVCLPIWDLTHPGGFSAETVRTVYLQHFNMAVNAAKERTLASNCMLEAVASKPPKFVQGTKLLLYLCLRSPKANYCQL